MCAVAGRIMDGFCSNVSIWFSGSVVGFREIGVDSVQFRRPRNDFVFHFMCVVISMYRLVNIFETVCAKYVKPDLCADVVQSVSLAVPSAVHVMLNEIKVAK